MHDLKGYIKWLKQARNCSQTHARIPLFPGFFETDHGIDS